MQTPLRTKDVVIKLGIGREALRFYEQQGLIPDPKRNEAGYREYSPEIIRRLQFIKVAQETGFTLNEIKEFLSIGHQSVSREFVIRKIDSKLAVINDKMASLQNIKKTLEHLKKQTKHDKSEFIVCPLSGKINLTPS